MDQDIDGTSRALVVPTGGVLGQHDEKHKLFVQTLTEAQVDFLLQRTPKHEIKERQGRGGLRFSYVEHGYVTERLNLVFGFNWDFEVVDKQMLEDEVIVEAKLTVRTPGGQTIVKTQFGGADIKRHASGARSGRPLSIADDYKAAASDALKKCASLLGIGLDLYGRDRPEEVEEERPQVVQAEMREQGSRRKGQAAPMPIRSVNEAPSHLDSPCTPVQVEEITNLAEQASMDLGDLCSNLGIRDLTELTRARAERVMKRLKQLAS
jgi:hypothetical protein